MESISKKDYTEEIQPNGSFSMTGFELARILWHYLVGGDGWETSGRLAQEIFGGNFEPFEVIENCSTVWLYHSFNLKPIDSGREALLQLLSDFRSGEISPTDFP